MGATLRASRGCIRLPCVGPWPMRGAQGAWDLQEGSPFGCHRNQGTGCPSGIQETLSLGPRPWVYPWGEIQSREARGGNIYPTIPQYPPRWPPLSGLDYAHSGGPRSHLIYQSILVICTDFYRFFEIRSTRVVSHGYCLQ